MARGLVQKETTPMACLPNPGKCEWVELKHFIAHYNETRSSDYQHECCLDLKSSQKSPEVICRSSDDKSLVVERKNLVWPLDYVQRHKAEHFLWDAILVHLRVVCSDGPYLLSIAPPSIVAESKLSELAAQIADAVKRVISPMRSGEKIEFVMPCQGVFQKQIDTERDFDEPPSGLMILSSTPKYQELTDPGHTPDAFIEKVLDYFSACEGKFSAYGSSIRVLLLNFISYQLYEQCNESWWHVFFDIYNPPSSICQIWSSFNYDDQSWNFEQLYGTGRR